MLAEIYAHPNPVALVTGSGADRVGRAISKKLYESGCQLALHANTSLDEAEHVAARWRSEGTQRVEAFEANLSNAETADQLVRNVVEQFGRIDILVNCAAIWSPTKLEDVTASEVRNYFEINTLACFMIARTAGLQMVNQASGGAIVNLSDWATCRPYLDHAAYFPSKGAIDTMTRSLAVELGRRNSRVRVNAIKPGPVLLASDVAEDRAEMIGRSTLVGTVGTAEHVAHAVQFLCENTYVNGVCLPVDGGRTIYAPDGLQDGLNTG
ncbi:MAG: SDR family oxidoreductase [Planctomycetota bacterium]